MDEFPATIARIPIEDDAKALIRERTKTFGVLLTIQAQVLAQSQGHDHVVRKHVEEAADVLRPGRSPIRWKRSAFLSLGSLLLVARAPTAGDRHAAAGHAHPTQVAVAAEGEALAHPGRIPRGERGRR